MLDVIYLALTLALFALVGLIARGLQGLDQRAGGSTPRNATGGEARR